jgi:hypothetical protein
MIDEVLKNRIETALYSDNLMNLFEQLESEGLGKKELENIFTEFLNTIPQDEKRESDEEKIIELIEGITGYCHPERCLFPPEKYQPYRGIIHFFASNEDRELIVRFIFENTSFRLFRDYSYENGELEIKSIEDFISTNHLSFYLWNEKVSKESSIHEKYFEHIQKTCWSFISDPTFILNFGSLEENFLEPSVVTHAFQQYPTQESFDTIEPIRAFIDKLQVATAIGIPVLPNAYSLTKQGIRFKESAETRWDYELDSISV